MKKYLLLLLMLAGCDQPQVEHDPLIADVPVAVSCNAEKVAAPDWNAGHLAKDAPAIDEFKAALADLDLSKGYIDELQTELQACS